MLPKDSTCSHLLSLLSGDGKRCVAVLEAYLDESGLDGRWPVVCVAGYVGRRDQWAAFEKAWPLVLHKAGVECFHATESKSHPLWEPMLDHIRAIGLRGLLVTASSEHYRGLMVPQARSIVGNAYAACTFSCVLKIAALAKANGHGPVAFVIEDGQPNVKWVRDTLEIMMNNRGSHIASVTVAKKKAFVPLQSADFLAHCAGTYQKEWLEVLVGDGPGQVFHGHMTRAMLSDVSAKLEKIAQRYRHMKHQAKLAARRARNGPPPPSRT